MKEIILTVLLLMVILLGLFCIGYGTGYVGDKICPLTSHNYVVSDSVTGMLW